ncbi:M56 family metallopeptidase [Paenibacillus sp. NPDC058071]|uniref:M56 family metallopeptidase n=1 Tax=Paenibacillus sp. NPDC058071 TaxID=3346326 RepID=UPI0036DC7F39
MSPPVRLRWIYALTVALLALFCMQMGLLAARQIEGGALEGSLFIFILFDLIIGYTIVRAVWRVAAQAYLSRKLQKLFASTRHAKLTKRLNYQYRHFGTEIMVVQDEAFIALAHGMFKPKIVISTQVLHMFSDKEVKAILLHEWHHCRNRDQIKLFTITLLKDAFGYWPIMKPLFSYYQTWTELLADRFAIRRMGTELHLANVLLKLSKSRTAQSVAAVHFSASAMHYRIMQVLEPHQTVKVKIALFRPLLASFSLLLLLLLGGDA